MEHAPKIPDIPGVLPLFVCVAAGICFGGDAVGTELRPQSPPQLNVEWDAPSWANNLEPVTVSARIDTPAVLEVVCQYAYPNGTKGKVTGEPSVDDAREFSFRIPAEPDAGIGNLTLYLETTTRGGMLRSGETAIPMGYEEDLDITGDPPVVLPFPLGDETYLVKYVPCCNILGASTIAKRMPVNPRESSEGLPEVLLSDFVELEPDDLSASTAGLYFQFTYDPDMAAKRAPDGFTAYEYDWVRNEWQESPAFEVDEAAHTLTIHCVNGGTFVLGAKTR